MNAEKEIFVISAWLKEQVNESPARGYVIGLSGGIDSSVAAGLAVRAVGKENVIGILLPYWDDRPQDIEDAKRVAAHYDIQTVICPIKSAAESAIQTIEDNASIQVILSPIAKANIQARTRMLMLRAYAESTNCLVLGTTNKSEDIVGYFTKGGDGGSGVDVEPTAQYYKSEIRELGKALGLDDDLVQRVPTAGLMKDQTDEGELGFTYDNIELFWKWLTEDCIGDTEKCPVTLEIANKIIKMNTITEHKRNMPKAYERILC